MKLSIITINRNNAEGLRKTIESVVSQTFTDFEYIIIDGASTDGSVDVINEYADRITYWVSEPDKGIYNAMNKGSLKASGEYLFFLNSGDWLCTSSTLAIVVTNFDSKIDVFSGYAIELNENHSKKLPPKEFTLRHLYEMNIPHQSEFIRKVFFFQMNCYNEEYSILADYDFNIRSMLSNAIYKYSKIPISYVDCDGVSNAVENTSIMRSEKKEIFEKNVPYCIRIDYEYFFKKINNFHPSIYWLMNNYWLYRILKSFYRKIIHNR